MTLPLVPRGDEQYTTTIPAALCKDTIEYLIAAKDGRSQQSNQWDGSPDTWYRLSFVPAGAAPAPSATSTPPGK